MVARHARARLEALILAAAAALIPLAARGSDLTIAMFAGAVLAATLVAAPTSSALPLVLSGWAIYIALTLMSRKRPTGWRANGRTIGTCPETDTCEIRG